MYKTIILQLVFGIIFNYSFTQNTVTEVTYKTSIDLNTLPKNITSKYNEAKQQEFIKKHSNSNLLKYTLLYNNMESSFFLSDSLIGLEHDLNNNYLQKLISRKKKNKYYKNLKEKKVYQEKIMGGDKLLITGHFNQIKWKLTKEKKKIGKYECYKAILTEGKELLGFDEKMNIHAWYTPELPVPFGPLQFEGLPGLMLELTLGRNTYYSTAIKFNTDKKIIPLTEGENISQEEYSLFLKKFKEEMFSKKS